MKSVCVIWLILAPNQEATPTVERFLSLIYNESGYPEEFTVTKEDFRKAMARMRSPPGSREALLLICGLRERRSYEFSL